MVEFSRSTTEIVNKIINETDWNHYDACVNWALGKPACLCGYHEKPLICGTWVSWIEQGRLLYPRTRTGEIEYLARIHEELPALKQEDLLRIVRDEEFVKLNEANFYNPRVQ
jgi:hypothetical protein